MRRRPPGSARADPLVSYTTLFRSALSMQTFSVQPVSLPPATMTVREQVRALVARAAAAGHRMGLPNSWTAADPAFSCMLGAAGLLGITWRRRYGGGECSALERYLVLEEVLRSDAHTYELQS